MTDQIFDAFGNRLASGDRPPLAESAMDNSSRFLVRFGVAVLGDHYRHRLGADFRRRLSCAIAA
jgi:hypothetical protein